MFSLTFRLARLGRLDTDPLVPATFAMKSCSVCRMNLLGTRGRIGDRLADFGRELRIHWSSRSRWGVGAAVKSYVSDELQAWVVGNERAPGAVGAGARSGAATKAIESHGWNAELSGQALEYYERRNHDEGSRRPRLSRETDGRVFEDRRALDSLDLPESIPGRGFWGRVSETNAPLLLGFSSYRFGYALAHIAELGRSWNDFSRRSLEIRQRIYYRLKECGNRFGRRVREVVQ
jgi:hypothetical protein